MDKFKLTMIRIGAVATVALLPLLCRGADFDASDTESVVNTFRSSIVGPARTYVVWGLGIMAFFIVIGIGVAIVRKRMAGAKKI
jgi:hypothetical protein